MEDKLHNLIKLRKRIEAKKNFLKKQQEKKSKLKKNESIRKPIKNKNLINKKFLSKYKSSLNQVVKSTVKPVVKSTVKPVVKSTVKPVVKSTVKPVVKSSSNLKVTIISSLYNCDKFIDNFISCLNNLINFSVNKMIIWNVIDSNNSDTNNKIKIFCENNKNVILLEKLKCEDTGLYNAWNYMLKMVDTDLVCNYNVDDKLYPEYLVDYINEFEKDKNINLVFSPILISRNLNDSFDSKLNVTYNKKQIFFKKNDELKTDMNLDYRIKVFIDHIKNNCNLDSLNIKIKKDVNILDFFKIINVKDLESYSTINLTGPAPMWKKSLNDKYGYFNPNEYGVAADLELALRFMEIEGNFRFLEKPYVIWYKYDNNLGSKFKKSNISKIVKKYHPNAEFLKKKNISYKTEMKNKITLFSSLFNCDQFIDNYLNCLKNLKSLENNKLIIWNVVDSNSIETNKKIDNFCENKKYIKLLKKTKSEDTGLYDSWNRMIEMADTELVCNFNAYDKLHPDFLIDYCAEFDKDDKLNLLCSPLMVSKNIKDNFNSKLSNMFTKKMIFYNSNEIVGNFEPEHMNLEYKMKILEDYKEGKINVSKKHVEYKNFTIFDFFNNRGDILKMDDWTPCNLVGCAPMWKKSLYDKYGGFNEEEFKGAADFDLWLRFFSKEGNFKKLDKPYVIYYMNRNSYFHKENNDEVHKKLVENYLNIDFNKILCIEPMFGLGNRLRAIASAYSIAKANNYLLKILWVPDCHCDIEFNELFKNNFMLLKSIDLSNFKKYNYYEVENPNGKGEYIDTNYKKIYVKSNCILSNKHSFEYFNEFFNILIPSDDVASKLIDTSNMIGVHCRMGGGANQENVKADKLDNWTNQEQLYMIKYRNLSHVDYFINMINEELLKNFNQKIYVACDLPSSYEKLERIYGDKIVKLNRNSYNRDKTEIIEGLADMLNLSKCYKFYGSFWSSFSENVTYFSQHKNNIMSNHFYRTEIDNKNYFGIERNKTKNTIVTACMNRNDNLKQAIVSWLNVKNLDEIVIIDWGSKNKVEDTLKEFNDSRIKVYRVDNVDKWVLSHAFNIGLLCSSNENIYKLDCDDIVRSDLIIEHPLDENSFYAGNWKNAKTQNELQINGKLFCQFNNLKKVNFYNENITSYGYEDEDLYKRLIDNKLIRKNVNINLFKFIKHNDNLRLENNNDNNLNKEEMIKMNRELCLKYNKLNWSTKYNLNLFEFKNNSFKLCRSFYIRNKTKTYSVVIAHKNRFKNILNTLKSIINSKYINDIVICDFYSSNDLYDFLKKNIINNFNKINIIKINTPVQYIASICNNIALYHAKNENILKLDADNIVNNIDTFIEKYKMYDLNDTFIHFDWKYAKNENEQHLNGIFYLNKTNLINVGFHNNDILFYGWEDCEFKNRLKKNKKEIILDSSFFNHQEQEDNERVINQNNTSLIKEINFFGFNIKNIISVAPLILYNKILSETYNNTTSLEDVEKLIKNIHVNEKYKEYEIDLSQIKTFDTNCNYLNSSKSICRFEIFEKMLISSNNTLWLNETPYNKYIILYNYLLNKYNFTKTQQKIILFYLLIFTNGDNLNNSENYISLNISLYNEKKIDRCLELLFCLKKNIKNNYIKKINIFLEVNNDSEHFIKDFLTEIMIIDEIWQRKILIININSRPTFNSIFNYVDKNINGRCMVANSDIIYDNTLKHIPNNINDKFIILTRYQKYNEEWKIINFSCENESKEWVNNNVVNIFSVDSWIFNCPMKYKLDIPLFLGSMFSDSFINYKLFKSNYDCYNMGNKIFSYHVQEDISCSGSIKKKEKDNLWKELHKLINYETSHFLHGIDFEKNNICWENFWHESILKYNEKLDSKKYMVLL